jgi:hypothetical protein
MTPGTNVIDFFLCHDALNKVFIPDEPSQPTLELWVRPGAYPRVAHLFRASATKKFFTTATWRQSISWKMIPLTTSLEGTWGTLVDLKFNKKYILGPILST